MPWELLELTGWGTAVIRPIFLFVKSEGDDLLSRADMDRMQELRDRLLTLRSDLRAVQSVLTRDVAAILLRFQSAISRVA